MVAKLLIMQMEVFLNWIPMITKIIFLHILSSIIPYYL